ncbi:MAG: ABC transporter permease [Anaerolineae bacterium]|nr:ABC transporter permease [Anaerolineae bacterium]
MKILSVFRKSLLEQVRDVVSLVLMLITAPTFVFLYYLFCGGGSTTYDVLVLNHDTGITVDGAVWNAGDMLVQALSADQSIQYEDGQAMLSVKQVSDRERAEDKLKDRDGDVLVIIPDGFSSGLAGGCEPVPPVILVGDQTNIYYSVAAVLTHTVLANFQQQLVAQRGIILEPPFQVTEEMLGDSGTRTEFETYVPGLLIFAVVMLMFPVAIMVAREVEAGTLRRLQLTRITAFDLLGGISAVQVLVGIMAVIFTFLTAMALGFESQGPLIVAIMVASVTSLSVIGVGLLVACFSKNVQQAFLIANFPLFLMMFFSGSIFPIPRGVLFSIGERKIAINDVLPPTHAVVALNKIMTLGEGLGDVLYEVSAVLLLSVLYFGTGIWLFQRLHLRQR